MAVRRRHALRPLERADPRNPTTDDGGGPRRAVARPVLLRTGAVDDSRTDRLATRHEIPGAADAAVDFRRGPAGGYRLSRLSISSARFCAAFSARAAGDFLQWAISLLAY